MAQVLLGFYGNSENELRIFLFVRHLNVLLVRLRKTDSSDKFRRNSNIRTDINTHPPMVGLKSPVLHPTISINEESLDRDLIQKINKNRTNESYRTIYKKQKKNHHIIFRFPLVVREESGFEDEIAHVDE